MELIKHYFDQLGELSPAVFVFAILLGLNLLLRRTPKVPNWIIPWVSILAGILLFPYFVEAATNFKHSGARNAGLGFLVGLVAAFGYGVIVKFAEAKWPWLANVINGETKPPN